MRKLTDAMEHFLELGSMKEDAAENCQGRREAVRGSGKLRQGRPKGIVK